MGALQTLNILTKVSQEWKDKYIYQWLAIAPALGGSVTEMKIAASGDNEGVPWVSGYQIREE